MPLAEYENVNNFNKIREIIKIACYCLFNTVPNKLFHMITDIYIFSTRQNNNWIYKNDPVQKFTHPWILILCCFLDDPRLFFCVVIVVHESLVGSEQFNCCSSEKSSSSCTFFGFPAFSAYLNPFQQWLYDFEIHLFTLRAIGVLIHSYYKRWKHLLMLKKETWCIKSRGV